MKRIYSQSHIRQKTQPSSTSHTVLKNLKSYRSQRSLTSASKSKQKGVSKLPINSVKKINLFDQLISSPKRKTPHSPYNKIKSNNYHSSKTLMKSNFQTKNKLSLMSQFGPDAEITNLCLADIKNLIQSSIKQNSFLSHNNNNNITSRSIATPFKTTLSASAISKYGGKKMYNRVMPMPAFYSRDNTPIKLTQNSDKGLIQQQSTLQGSSRLFERIRSPSLVPDNLAYQSLQYNQSSSMKDDYRRNIRSSSVGQTPILSAKSKSQNHLSIFTQFQNYVAANELARLQRAEGLDSEETLQKVKQVSNQIKSIRNVQAVLNHRINNVIDKKMALQSKRPYTILLPTLKTPYIAIIQSRGYETPLVIQIKRKSSEKSDNGMGVQLKKILPSFKIQIFDSIGAGEL